MADGSKYYSTYEPWLLLVWRCIHPKFTPNWPKSVFSAVQSLAFMYTDLYLWLFIEVSEVVSYTVGHLLYQWFNRESFKPSKCSNYEPPKIVCCENKLLFCVQNDGPSENSSSHFATLYQEVETEAAKLNSAIIRFLIYTCDFPAVTCLLWKKPIQFYSLFSYVRCLTDRNSTQSNTVKTLTMASKMTIEINQHQSTKRKLCVSAKPRCCIYNKHCIGRGDAFDTPSGISMYYSVNVSVSCSWNLKSCHFLGCRIDLFKSVASLSARWLNLGAVM